MSKKKANAPIVQKNKTAVQPAQTKFAPPAKANDVIPFHLNILLLFVTIAILFVLYKSVPGYAWVKDSLIKDNLEMIKKYPKASYDDKVIAKQGFDYAVLVNALNYKEIPENAVILFPPHRWIDTIRQKNNAMKLGPAGLNNGHWLRYFVYPRYVVYEDQKETSPLYKKATHVAVMAGWGYDKLNYTIPDSIKIAQNGYKILPISQ